MKIKTSKTYFQINYIIHVRKISPTVSNLLKAIQVQKKLAMNLESGCIRKQ